VRFLSIVNPKLARKKLVDRQNKKQMHYSLVCIRESAHNRNNEKIVCFYGTV
jgi:hypothetical protein